MNGSCLKKLKNKESETNAQKTKEKTWWEKIKAQAKARLKAATQKRQAHSAYIKEGKQMVQHYHRGHKKDCKTCKQTENRQQQEKKEEVDEMELYDYEWAEWEKMGNTESLEWEVEPEQYKREREERRINREEEMNFENVEKGYIEDEEMERAVQNYEMEQEMEANYTEEEEEEIKDGECLGCGCEQRKGTQCLSCGAPVEPKKWKRTLHVRMARRQKGGM